MDRTFIYTQTHIKLYYKKQRIHNNLSHIDGWCGRKKKEKKNQPTTLNTAFDLLKIIRELYLLDIHSHVYECVHKSTIRLKYTTTKRNKGKKIDENGYQRKYCVHSFELVQKIKYNQFIMSQDGIKTYVISLSSSFNSYSHQIYYKRTMSASVWMLIALSCSIFIILNFFL